MDEPQIPPELLEFRPEDGWEPRGPWLPEIGMRESWHQAQLRWAHQHGLGPDEFAALRRKQRGRPAPPSINDVDWTRLSDHTPGG